MSALMRSMMKVSTTRSVNSIGDPNGRPVDGPRKVWFWAVRRQVSKTGKSVVGSTR
jgi:hypothetical protein